MHAPWVVQVVLSTFNEKDLEVVCVASVQSVANSRTSVGGPEINILLLYKWPSTKGEMVRSRKTR
jgi:hypothetical protein